MSTETFHKVEAGWDLVTVCSLFTFWLSGGCANFLRANELKAVKIHFCALNFVQSSIKVLIF